MRKSYILISENYRKNTMVKGFGNFDFDFTLSNLNIANILVLKLRRFTIAIFCLNLF